MDTFLPDYDENEFDNHTPTNHSQNGYGNQNVPQPPNNYNQPKPQQPYNQQNNYSQPQTNNYQNNGQQPQQNNYTNHKSNNSYGNKPTGGNQDWREKQKQILPPYMPIGIYFERDFTPEVVNELIELASGLINQGFTVRYNADNPEIHQRMRALSFTNTEDYGPMKDFAGMESRFCWNNNTSNDIASKTFADPSKVSRGALMFTSRNVRIVLGNTNKNNIKFVITHSSDGASNTEEVSKDTGNVGYFIKLADKFFCPVYNIGNPRRKDFVINKIINRGY